MGSSLSIVFKRTSRNITEVTKTVVLDLLWMVGYHRSDVNLTSETAVIWTDLVNNMGTNTLKHHGAPATNVLDLLWMVGYHRSDVNLTSETAVIWTELVNNMGANTLKHPGAPATKQQKSCPTLICSRMVLICGSKPMSSIRSASSITRYVVRRRFVRPDSRKSIRRPGVAMQI